MGRERVCVKDCWYVNAVYRDTVATFRHTSLMIWIHRWAHPHLSTLVRYKHIKYAFQDDTTPLPCSHAFAGVCNHHTLILLTPGAHTFCNTPFHQESQCLQAALYLPVHMAHKQWQYVNTHLLPVQSEGHDFTCVAQRHSWEDNISTQLRTYYLSCTHRDSRYGTKLVSSELLDYLLSRRSLWPLFTRRTLYSKKTWGTARSRQRMHTAAVKHMQIKFE